MHELYNPSKKKEVVDEADGGIADIADIFNLAINTINLSIILIYLMLPWCQKTKDFILFPKYYCYDVN